MVRNLCKLIGIVAGSALVVYGLHGLYSYFYRLEVIFGKGSKLFGEIAMPSQITEYIQWMSAKGAQSWFIPIIFVIIGVALWYWQSKYVWRPVRL